MNTNEQRMTLFYRAFQELDYKTMQECYTDDAVFFDPAFGMLDADQLRAMWEMLCKNAREFSLEFSNVVAEDEYGTCNWVAVYRFSKTGRKVVNHIKAHMKFRDGRICEHSDAFKLGKWAAQALGWKGVFLGWTGFMQRKIQKSSRAALEKFMMSQKESRTY